MKTDTKTLQERYYKNQDKIHKPNDDYYQSLSRYKLEQLNKSLWDVVISNKGMNKCQICGYDRHFSAIEMHHIDPKKKKIIISKLYRLKPTPTRIKELNKCVALCANCHRLVHNEVIFIYKDESGWHCK